MNYMSMETRTHIDPSQAPKSAAETKQCISCWGKFPIAFFSYNKYKRDGYHVRCKQCHSQMYRLQRKTKYNAKPRTDHDDSIIRNVMSQNDSLLGTYLGMKHSCIGYCPHTGQVFKLVFGDGNYSMYAVSIFSMDGHLYQSYEYSGIQKDLAMTQVSTLLRNMQVRLEKTEADMLVSKSYIYLESVGDPIRNGTP